MRRLLLAVVAIAAFASDPAAAQSAAGAQDRSAVIFDVFASTDADDNEVAKASATYDWRYDGAASHQGVRIETARFSPREGAGLEEQRIYLQAADQRGDWSYAVSAGTNGQSLVGSASLIREEGARQEFFIERERVETPIGLADDHYQTFVGVALDLPMGEATTLALVGGVQDYTGDNIRAHARATLTQVLSERYGVSVALRSRYFANSEPGEFDYYSPDWFAEVIPVLQVRRRQDGWRYGAGVGYGAQGEADSDWRGAGYLNAFVERLPSDEIWVLRADLLHTTTPGVRGFGYDYTQAMLRLGRAF